MSLSAYREVLDAEPESAGSGFTVAAQCRAMAKGVAG